MHRIIKVLFAVDHLSIWANLARTLRLYLGEIEPLISITSTPGWGTLGGIETLLIVIQNRDKAYSWGVENHISNYELERRLSLS